MIIVLEGLNGSGKSAVAHWLSETWGLPVVRLFRGGSDDHLEGGRLERLRSLGIPANTFVEDVFVADLLVRTGQGAILDRSMPSGLAYGILEDRITSESARKIMKEWCDILRPAQVHILHLKASRQERERRTTDRKLHPDDGVLEEWIQLVMSWCDLPVSEVDTTALSKEVMLERCLECLR